LQNADQRLIDKQMVGVIEAIMIQSFSLANRGFIPSAKQTAAYIQSLDKDTLLQKIRKHPGAAGTHAQSADDAQLLRWAGLVGQEPTR
jgi:hypothetical protein